MKNDDSAQTGTSFAMSLDPTFSVLFDSVS